MAGLAARPMPGAEGRLTSAMARDCGSGRSLSPRVGAIRPAERPTISPHNAAYPASKPAKPSPPASGVPLRSVRSKVGPRCFASFYFRLTETGPCPIAKVFLRRSRRETNGCQNAHLRGSHGRDLWSRPSRARTPRRSAGNPSRNRATSLNAGVSGSPASWRAYAGRFPQGSLRIWGR